MNCTDRMIHKRTVTVRVYWTTLFQVDFKRGIRVTKDMIKALKTPVNGDKAKPTVRGFKREYHDYKRRGGNKSYESWIIDKGYGERRPECCIMWIQKKEIKREVTTPPQVKKRWSCYVDNVHFWRVSWKKPIKTNVNNYWNMPTPIKSILSARWSSICWKIEFQWTQVPMGNWNDIKRCCTNWANAEIQSNIEESISSSRKVVDSGAVWTIVFDHVVYNERPQQIWTSHRRRRWGTRQTKNQKRNRNVCPNW